MNKNERRLAIIKTPPPNPGKNYYRELYKYKEFKKIGERLIYCLPFIKHLENYFNTIENYCFDEKAKHLFQEYKTSSSDKATITINDDDHSYITLKDNNKVPGCCLRFIGQIFSFDWYKTAKEENNKKIVPRATIFNEYRDYADKHCKTHNNVVDQVFWRIHNVISCQRPVQRRVDGKKLQMVFFLDEADIMKNLEHYGLTCLTTTQQNIENIPG